MATKIMDNSELLQKITEYGFALNDLNLYLNTHPEDSESLTTYNTLRDNYHSLCIEYARRYGPLNSNQVTSDNYWTWVSTPWPWEGACK